jgi:hypothetical protein
MDLPISEFFNTGFEVSCSTSFGTFNVHYLNEFEAKGQEIQFEGSNPMMYAKTSDVENLTHDSTVIINSIVYKVGQIQHDGVGITIVELYR